MRLLARLVLVGSLLVAALASGGVLVTSDDVLPGHSQRFNVREYGAKGDGVTLDTVAISATFSACSQYGGGTVIFPAGRYLTGPFNLTSYTTVWLEKDATILASTNASDYNFVYDFGMRYQPVVFGYKVTNVRIHGHGTIDGQGAAWWPALPDAVRPHAEKAALAESLDSSPSSFSDHPSSASFASPSPYLHPYGTPGYPQHAPPMLLSCNLCEDLEIRGITLQYSPFWTLVPIRSNRVHIHNITIYNPIESVNTDCIDPDSSTNVHIHHSTLTCGDDVISVKADFPGVPSVNVSVHDLLVHQGQGLTIGSATLGGIKNVTFRDSTMLGGLVGIRFKTQRARGGPVEGILYDNLNFYTVAILMSVNMNFDHTGPAQNSSLTPSIRDVTVRNIKGWGVSIAELQCLPESPCKGWLVSNFTALFCKDWVCDHIHGVATEMQRSDRQPCPEFHRKEEGDEGV